MKYFYFFIINFIITLRKKFISNCIYIVLSLIICSILILFDNYIFNRILEIHGFIVEPIEVLNDILISVFETKNLLAILLGALILLNILKSKWTSRILYTISLNLLSIGVFFILKIIFSRERPYISFNPYNIFMWKSLSLKDYNSFFSLPSGHIMVLISTYALWERFFLTKILFYITFILLAFFRIYSLQHWPSDICMAVFFSIFIIYNNKSSLIEE